MFIKMYGLSLTDKSISALMWEVTKHYKYAVKMINYSNLWKEDAHSFFLMHKWYYHLLHLTAVILSWHLNGYKRLFHLFRSTIRHIFEPLHVYEPGFKTNKYSTDINISSYDTNLKCTQCVNTHHTHKKFCDLNAKPHECMCSWNIQQLITKYVCTF